MGVGREGSMASNEPPPPVQEMTLFGHVKNGSVFCLTLAVLRSTSCWNPLLQILSTPLDLHAISRLQNKH